MNWDAVGAMAEWFGVIGVIVSLIYLAKQIQHSIKQDTKNRIETTYLSFADIRKSLIESEELARIFTVGISEPDQLSELDVFRFMAISETLFALSESFWKQLENQFDEWLDITLEFCAFYLSTPGGKAFWKHPQSYNLTKSFRTMIENFESVEQNRLDIGS